MTKDPTVGLQIGYTYWDCPTCCKAPPLKSSGLGHLFRSKREGGGGEHSILGIIS